MSVVTDTEAIQRFETEDIPRLTVVTVGWSYSEACGRDILSLCEDFWLVSVRFVVVVLNKQVLTYLIF